MPSMDIVFAQILVILLYVAIGYIAGKSGLIKPEQRKYLTRICTDLILPFTIISASSLTVSRQDLLYLAMITGLVMLLFILTSAAALGIQTLRHTPRPLKIATASLVTYPNCTFLGLPLCRALFGEIAVLYNAVAVVAFNVLFFSWTASAFTGKKFRFRNLVTPPTIATALVVPMLALGWHLPSPVQTVASNTGAMITPLSLFIIGAMMSEHKLTAILRERRAYMVTLVRNLMIPLIVMLPLRLLDIEPASRVCLLVYMACPCGALSSIYAIQNNMEPEFASRSVLMSTLFFAGTLPVIIFLGTRVLGNP